MSENIMSDEFVFYYLPVIFALEKKGLVTRTSVGLIQTASRHVINAIWKKPENPAAGSEIKKGGLPRRGLTGSLYQFQQPEGTAEFLPLNWPPVYRSAFEADRPYMTQAPLEQIPPHVHF
jgi:hypothetical protein